MDKKCILFSAISLLEKGKYSPIHVYDTTSIREERQRIESESFKILFTKFTSRKVESKESTLDDTGNS